MTTQSNQQPDGVQLGGLMRCCLATLDELYPNGPAAIAAEGQRLQCKYAPPASDHGWMVFTDGSWRWKP
jgi:hypothetical protein